MSEELKSKRGTAKGNLTRLMNQVRELMKSDNVESVKQKFASLDKLVSEYTDIHGKYHALCDNENDISDSDKYDTELKDSISEFKESVNTWIHNANKGEPVDPDKLEQSNSKSLELTRAQVTSHREQLEDTMRMLSKRRELEMRALEVEMERKKVASDLEMLQIEEQLSQARANETVIMGSTEIPADFKLPPPKPRSRLSWGESTIYQETPSSPTSTRSSVSTVNDQKVTPPQSIDSSFKELLNESRLQQKSFVEAMQLPKTELITFDGDPRLYWQFIRSFENIVDKETISDSAKLARLVQYCTGRAKRILQCCLVKEPSEGYKHALKLLRDRFGNPNDVSQAWITKIMSVSRITSIESLQDYADELLCCKENLETMGYLHELDNSAMLVKLISKLPDHLQSRWLRVNHKLSKAKRAHLTDVVDFIVSCADESSDPVFGKLNNKRFESTRNDKKRVQHPRAYYSNVPNDRPKSTTKCAYCSNDHYITRCEKFRALRVKDRLAYVQSKQLCVNCFKPYHSAKTCTRQFVCDIDGCGKKHNRFLHLPSVSAAPVPGVSNPNSLNNEAAATSATTPKDTPKEVDGYFTNTASNSANVTNATKSKIALPIVPVRVRDIGRDAYIDTYALLDNGSTQTFCSEKLIRDLDISTRPETLSLTTLEARKVRSSTDIVHLQLSDINDATSFRVRNVMSRPRLNIDPGARIEAQELSKWEHLLDIDFPELPTSEVHLLIGLDAPDILRPLENRFGNPGEMYATKTVFGWTINGPRDTSEYTISNCPTSHFIQPDIGLLEQQVERMWEIDNVTNDIKPMSLSDKKVVSLWEKSITKVNGHYTMDIPFKTKPPNLPNNFAMANHRFRLLQKRLHRDSSLNSRYSKEINNLLTKGFAERVPFNETNRNDGSVWYLPHHPVFNPKKPDKCRIVFDCSAKYQDISLNDVVHQGPDLMNTLIGVLLRFRQESVAIMADIEGMFNQVKVSANDKDVLRFLWSSDHESTSTGAPDIYRMTTHLFGGIWSPSCAQFALKQCLKDNVETYDAETISTVDKDFYVDDCLKSIDTEEKAVQIVHQLRELLSNGGFHLTKWLSNSQAVLDSIPEYELAKAASLSFDQHQPVVERALGVLWRVDSDSFGFLTSNCDKPFTKRGLLSFVSSIFDPLGIAGPYTINAKAMFQSLCRLKCEWDENLPEFVQTQWTRWLTDLPIIDTLELPRCIKPLHFAYTKAQIHVFADASEKQYGSVAYIRLENEHGEIHCNFLMAKVKLAPLKSTTIPRLELMAAVEAVKLDNLLTRELNIPLTESVFWTDSSIVLWYLRNEEKRFKTFVANRTSKIHEHSSVSQWKHVPSAQNAADVLSRGCSATDLVNSDVWLNGPKFLWSDVNSWPGQAVVDISDKLPENAEVKIEKAAYSTNVELKPIDTFIQRYSDYYKLKKGVAWLRRFVCHIMKQPVSHGNLSVTELKSAEKSIIRYVQRENIQPTQMRSLQSLLPFSNADGLLCVGGRLQNADVSECIKHPYIIPHDQHITKLIIREAHRKTGHSGSERVLAETRNSYWILRGRYAVRNVLARCIVCKRVKSQPLEQRMSNLPKCRVSKNEPPFIYVGVDFFGPFTVKKGRSDVKRYGCVFTCMSTRAVHLEVCHSLDTDSFINALQRFTARRGKAKEIWTDNGSNFVGAKAELRKALAECNKTRIEDHLRQQEIKWIFNPPAASHMGGVWERLIRSVRTILMSIIPKGRLDDETLPTLMCVVESIINGRPITKLSADPSDPAPLTPNHILLLRNDSSFPQINSQKQDLYKRRWKQVQWLADEFWNRWLCEYLPSLQKRQKWLQKHRNLQVGDLVLVNNVNTPRNMWPLGLIIETYMGQDMLVRSAKIKTSQGVYVRPISKLCLLEGCEFLEQSN